MKKVQILLSSYNGEKYIQEQINSILNQSYKNIELLIRDDGSTDKTLDILSEYSHKYDNINVIVGKNVGVIESFFELMKLSDKSCDYFALSDQDDYWLEDKLKVAIDKIELSKYDSYLNLPILYCSNPKIVDQNLNELKNSVDKIIKKPSFGNAMIENINTGCTCVFNRELLEKVLYKVPEKNVIMHDWWLYLVATAFGKVIYDQNSYVLYRQHSNNVIGKSDNFVGKWKKRIKFFKKNKYRINEQLKTFREIFVFFLNNEKKNNLEMFFKSRINLKEKLNLLNNKEIYRHNSLDMFIFRILFVFNLV